MTAITKDRNTRRSNGDVRVLPVAANTTLYAGTMLAVNAAGQLVPPGTAGAVRVVGYAQTNSTGLATHPAWLGVSGPWVNGSGADQVTAADVGATVYAVDNQTIAKTDTGGRLAAGTVWSVDADGVWVKFI